MPEQNKFDVVILGTGPAGLQAAIHAARRKVSVLVLGKESKSSLFHAHVENFCCIFNLTGEKMLQSGRQQAVEFGAVLLDEDVLKITPVENRFDIFTESGTTIQTAALIIATGSTRDKLGVSGETELLGRGVSYCVECDANFFKDQDVAVIGGESAAVSGALTLLEYARTVHLVCDKLEVAGALENAIKNSKVVLHQGIGVEAIEGEKEVSALLLKDRTSLPVQGVFIEKGARGVMELASHLGIMLDDEMKFIQTDKQMATNVPGVYAAGDICGPPWQMAKAVGEGCVAGLSAAAYAKKLRQGQI